MSTNLEAIEAEALKLAPSDRSHLLEKLIASLDLDPEVEAAWTLEADRREAEIESGESVAVSGPEVVARLVVRHQHRKPGFGNNRQ
ncbi:MAG: addiction module protein [Aquabacterium sp.]|nr:addiction module protein [Aquabacterium sp.]